jgi:hypothetical protein
MVRLVLIEIVAVCVACGPRVDECRARGEPEVSFPEGIDPDLLRRAVDEAEARFDRFIGQPHRGFAFRGQITSNRGNGEDVGPDALGVLTPLADGGLSLEFSDPGGARVSLRFDDGTTTFFGASCPTTVPTPEPGEAITFDRTSCVSQSDNDEVSFSVRAEPIEEQELTWETLLSLNDIRAPDVWTPYRGDLERDGVLPTFVDQTSHKEGPEESRTYVDYEAVWRIDPEQLDNACLVRVEVAHAETCTFGDFHWHGRYDVSCYVIATVDGRPGWADNY